MSSIYQKRSGFTIVELVVAIAVIGILAAITIVSYIGVRDRASDSAVQSDLSGLGKQFELFYTKNAKFPNTVADLTSLSVGISRSSYSVDTSVTPFNIIPCISSDQQAYSVAAVSKSGKRFYISSSRGVTEYTGAATWTGSNNFQSMCSSTLSGSVVISGGSGFGTTWRAWTGV